MLEVLNAARKAKLRVFYAMHHRYRPGDYETWKYIPPIQKGAWQRKSFEYGTWGGEFRAEFVPEASEIVATEHWCSSGFANTDLDLQLKNHGIHQLIVIGLVAHTCISHRPLRGRAWLRRHGGERRGRGASTTPRPASASPSYEAIRALEQVGVLSWVNRTKTSPPCSATRCNDVARSRVVGTAFSVGRGPGAARRQGGECGSGQIKPQQCGARNPMQRRCADRPTLPFEHASAISDHTPGGHEQARTVDHPQNRRAQHSPRARARAKMSPLNQAVGMKTGFPRGPQVRDRSQERPLGAHAPALGPGRMSSRSSPLRHGRVTVSLRSDGVTATLQHRCVTLSPVAVETGNGFADERERLGGASPIGRSHPSVARASYLRDGALDNRDCINWPIRAEGRMRPTRLFVRKDARSLAERLRDCSARRPRRPPVCLPACGSCSAASIFHSSRRQSAINSVRS